MAQLTARESDLTFPKGNQEFCRKSDSKSGSVEFPRASSLSAYLAVESQYPYLNAAHFPHRRAGDLEQIKLVTATEPKEIIS